MEASTSTPLRPGTMGERRRSLSDKEEEEDSEGFLFFNEKEENSAVLTD